MPPGKGKKGKGRGQRPPESQQQQQRQEDVPPVSAAATQNPPGGGRGRGRGRPPTSHGPTEHPSIPHAPLQRTEAPAALPPQRAEAAAAPPPQRAEAPAAPPPQPRPSSTQAAVKQPVPAPSTAPLISKESQRAMTEASDQSRAQPMSKEEKKCMERELASSFYNLKLTDSFPRRPTEPATNGRPIKLVSNCFQVNVLSGTIYHYDVEINPRGDAKVKQEEKKKYRALSYKVNRKIMELLFRSRPEFNNILPVYDGRKNLLTSKKIRYEGNALKCTIVLPAEGGDREKHFDVTIKFAVPIELETLHSFYRKKQSAVPYNALMALDIISRHGPSLAFTPIGRSFFVPPHPDDLHPLSGGREVWFGYHQSIRPGQWKPILIIDKANTVFHSRMPVLEFVENFCGRSVEQLRFITDQQRKGLTKELKSLIIRVTHQPQPRKYRIFEVTQLPAGELKFDITEQDGSKKKMTVADYFWKQYRRRLSYPNLPCLQMNPNTKQIYMPLEVCEIVEGQHCKRKLTDIQTAEMIRFTAIKPEARFKEIEHSVRTHMEESQRWMKEFGLKIDPRPLTVQGRVLEAPSVQYADRPEKPRDGSWNLQNRKFLKGAEVEKWILVTFDQRCQRQQLQKFAGMLVKQGRELGMHIGPPVDVCAVDPDRRNPNWVNDVFVSYKKHDIKLAVVILAKKDAYYREVKQAGDVKVGLITQCALKNNIERKLNPQYVANILQKINAKMGGQNNTIHPQERPIILRKPVIIIGVDVSHPAPSEHSKPSIAAAVGSLDATLSRYASYVKVQQRSGSIQSRVELIEEFKDMVKELLKAFYRQSRFKPEKIIVYRDGVSEGQFLAVRDHELVEIRKACKELQTDYEPGITFVVVQKRHHTRFRPEDLRADGVGKCQNIPPGTTVDTTVTQPVDFDFFLCSHFGIQGTSRPAHYYVIWDDNNFSSDELQKLTYHLCHVYARCTRTISAPAPVCYADLVAYHARHHLSGDDDVASVSSYSSDEAVPLSQSIINSVRIQEDLKSSMYFV